MPQDLPTDDPYADAYAELTRLSEVRPQDIFHVPGRTIVTPDMIQEYSRAKREKRAPALTPDELAGVKDYWRAWFVRMGSELPKWRQDTNKLMTKIDNVEDQISTVSWLAGLLLKKTPLAPLANLRAVEHVQRTLNRTQDLLSLRPGGRTAKQEHDKRQRKRRLDKLRGGNALQRGRAWLEANYTHLLEGAQATDTWWGVGLSLGPIMGAIDEGYFYLARWANEGYLDMAELMHPGSKDAFKAWADETDVRIYNFIMKPLKEIDWTGSSDDIQPHLDRAAALYDKLGDWFSRGKLTSAGWVLEEPQRVATPH